MSDQAYKDSGVDIDLAGQVKRRIKNIVAPTHGREVLDGVGGFGAMYKLSSYREPVLVSSVDGVGTKLRLCALMDKYDGIGEDLVNACVNDVIVCGAKPLFFLDYISVGKLEPPFIEELVQGMSRACQEVSCALIGGETAQMPGLYDEGEFDLAGFVLGVVERSEIFDPIAVQQGDILVGISSNGLHTNGYSLVRSVLSLEEDASVLGQFHTRLGQTLGEALLKPHRSYYQMVRQAFPLVKGMAHITGGGLMENVPRMLPNHLEARFDTSRWNVPPIFDLLRERGDISREEMYRVFNMGLGLVLVCEQTKVEEVVAVIPESRVVGEVVDAQGKGCVIL